MSAAFAKDQLKSFIERIERLEEEKKTIMADIREIYAEAKGAGFSTKTMRQIVRDRMMDRTDFQEAQAILELYRGAMGMLDEPLSDNARRRADGQALEPEEKDSPEPATQKKAGAPSAEVVATQYRMTGVIDG